MQSSSSFSNSRNGKSRPSDILSTRREPTESLPWPSPSFDVGNREGLRVSADPARPSTQIKSSPTGGLPPTPLTATYELTSLPLNEDGSKLKLPSVSNLLAHTPPNSNETRTVPLPACPDQHDDAPIRTGYSPKKQAALPSSASKSGIFQSASSEWTGNNASFSNMDRRQMAGRANADRRQSFPVSPRHFRNMPTSSEVQGLGLDLGEETPRLGSYGEWSMVTPTMGNQEQQLPGAPQIPAAQMSRFPTAAPSSPIKPPLRNWNTDLRFESREFVPRPPVSRSFSDAPASVAMEREQAMEMDGNMPLGHRNWGLAISTNGSTFRRGSLLHRADGSVIGPAMPQPSQITGPPTPTSSSFVFSTTSTGKAKAASPTVMSSASKRAHNSSGLTPHIHKTRLTPTVSASGKGKAKAGNSSDGVEVESPSLKMKSKQRSEQLRNQAEFIASQRNLPTDLPAPTTSSSPTSPTRDEDFAIVPEVYSRTAPPSISPRKRGASLRNVNVNLPSKLDQSSPWGVFGINPGHEAWQPLGPPTLSKVLGNLELTDNQAGGVERPENNQTKKARKGQSDGHGRFQKERSKSPGRTHRYSSEDKENDVFGSAAMSNKRTANASVPSSPTKMNQRRLVNIR